MYSRCLFRPPSASPSPPLCCRAYCSLLMRFLWSPGRVEWYIMLLRSLEILLRSLAIILHSLEILFRSLEIPIAFPRNTFAFSRNTIQLLMKYSFPWSIVPLKWVFHSLAIVFRSLAIYLYFIPSKYYCVISLSRNNMSKERNIIAIERKNISRERNYILFSREQNTYFEVTK